MTSIATPLSHEARVIIQNVFVELSPEDLCRCARVCKVSQTKQPIIKEWREFTKDEQLWKKKFEGRWPLESQSLFAKNSPCSLFKFRFKWERIFKVCSKCFLTSRAQLFLLIF